MRRGGLKAAVGAAVMGLCAALITGVGPSSAAAPPRYLQMTSATSADPGLSEFGGTFYVYATGDGPHTGDGILPIFSGRLPSGPFHQVGNIYANTPKGFASGNIEWAPHVTKIGSTYFAFFAGEQPGKKHCLFYATSSRPDGGFTQPKSMGICGNQPGWEAIDPSTYYSARAHQWYIVWRRGLVEKFPQGYYEIRARAITFSGSKVTLATGSQSLLLAKAGNPALSPKGTATIMEAPSLIYRAGHLWLFVARGPYNSRDYSTQVWEADSITSPFRPRYTLLQSNSGYGTGPGGAEVLASNGTVYIAYQAITGGTRVTRFARVTWAAKGHVGEPQIEPIR